MEKKWLWIGVAVIAVIALAMYYLHKKNENQSDQSELLERQSEREDVFDRLVQMQNSLGR